MENFVEFVLVFMELKWIKFRNLCRFRVDIKKLI